MSDSEHLSGARKWRLALHYSYPIALGYVPAAVAFGVLMSAAGLPAWLSAASSLIVYSGAAQYASVAMFAGGAGVLAMTLNTFIINLRHVFYAMPLLDDLPERKWVRWYSLFALTDESFSVLTTLPPPLRRPLMGRIVFCNQMYWVLGTLAGVGVGSGLGEWIPNLGFALNCLFVILAYEQYRNRREWWLCLLAAVAFWAAGAFTQQYLLLLAVALSVVFIVCRSAVWTGRAGE